jgi:hypothetical protein
MSPGSPVTWKSFLFGYLFHQPISILISFTVFTWLEIVGDSLVFEGVAENLACYIKDTWTLPVVSIRTGEVWLFLALDPSTVQCK